MLAMFDEGPMADKANESHHCRMYFFYNLAQKHDHTQKELKSAHRWNSKNMKICTISPEDSPAHARRAIVIKSNLRNFLDILCVNVFWTIFVILEAQDKNYFQN